MSSTLDRIATVDISLDSPVSNSEGFGGVLILAPAPQNPTGELPTVGVYKSLSEITELGITITGDGADPVGVAARVAFSQSPRPSKIYIAYAPETEETSVTDVLDTALATSGWYCVCPIGLENTVTAQVIEWTETQNKICGYIETNLTEPVVEAGKYYRSFGFFAKTTDTQFEAEIPAENKYGLAVAIAVKAMHYHAGEETWALKSLASVTPSVLSATTVAALGSSNLSYVTTVASKTVTMGGKTNAGEWIDVIRFRDWLQNDMQTRIVNLLIVNPKIPYTDGGIGLVENQMIASLKEGQKYGGIAPTEYNSDGEANEGYTTSVPLAADLSAAQKSSRVLENCRFSARLAGAIHLVEVTGSLHYENLFA